MIVGAVRQLADWLVDPTTGVNAQLPTVPGDPTDVPAPLVTVYDATRFEWVARGSIPRAKTGDGPLLLVRGPDEADQPLWAGGESGGWADVDLRVAYVRRPEITGPSDYAVAHAYQTLRAAVRALQAKFPVPAASPVRMGVQLERPRVAFIASNEELSGKEIILCSLSVTVSAFDPWVMGATVT